MFNLLDKSRETIRLPADYGVCVYVCMCVCECSNIVQIRTAHYYLV